MIQIHSNTILSMGFNPIIKAHNSNSWQIIYQKPSSHWQHHKAQFLLATSKAQFSLATSKSPVLTGNIKSPVFIGNIKKPSSHWQYQKSNLRWHYFIKSPRLLTLGKNIML